MDGPVPKIALLGSLEADVLVIGGGATGVRAAVAASEAGARTVLACKGVLGKSGNSPMAPFSLCAATGDGDPEDSPSAHFADTMAAGQYLNEPTLVEALVSEAPRAVRDLESYGLRWDRVNGARAQALMPGHTRPRACHVDHHTGRRMMQALVPQLRRLGVPALEDHVALSVLVRSGAAVGASLLDVRAGGVVAVAAKSVILATGGAGQLYSLTSNSTEATGDGFALALRAGARLIDMEMVQFNPTGLVRPTALRGTTTPPGILMGRGGHLVNTLGERFLARYDPANMENTTRDVASRAIFTEILQGRGDSRGAVFVDARHLPEEYLRTQHPGPFWCDYLLSLGLDIRHDMMEVAPSVHYMMGGITINERCETEVPGLFAAGECAGGIHGANRLAGNALAETQVFGARVGRSAAARKAPQAPATDVRQMASHDLEVLSALFRPDAPHSGVGLRAWEAKARLQEIMSCSAGVCRSGDGISQGLARLKGLAGTLEREMLVANRTVAFNMDLVEAVEMNGMALVAETILRSAGERQESLGAHFRTDGPETPLRPHDHVSVGIGHGDKIVLRRQPIGLR